LGLDPCLFRRSLDEIIGNPEVKVVVELAGGTGFAKTVVEAALDAGKHVVTANKALLASFGPALFSRARAQGKTIGFEASCAGAIPVVRTLAEDLVANRIRGLSGIVNGTCNFILTQMEASGLSYGTALKQAQEQGFAEADPFLDVSGTDSAHKLTLLASVALGVWVDWKRIPLRGLETLEPDDLAAAAASKARVKLLARAEATPHGFLFSVEPTVIPLGQPLAALDGPFNGVLVHGEETGFLYFQGRGAGARPTASAVVSDLAALASGTLGNTQAHYSCWPDRVLPAVPLPEEEIQGPWFVYRSKQKPEIIENSTRTVLEAQGFRVFPWYDPQE
jgi:homoserine dehydrogenase